MHEFEEMAKKVAGHFGVCRGCSQDKPHREVTSAKSSVWSIRSASAKSPSQPSTSSGPWNLPRR
jgi:hypothetical protein